MPLGHCTGPWLAAQPAAAKLDRESPLTSPITQLQSQCGAPDSDECVSFEDILAGVCGALNAAAAREILNAEAAGLRVASEQSIIRRPPGMDCSAGFDTTAGPRTAQSSWREPLVDSVFFSDSDGDWNLGGQRNARHAAGEYTKTLLAEEQYVHLCVLCWHRPLVISCTHCRRGSQAAAWQHSYAARTASAGVEVRVAHTARQQAASWLGQSECFACCCMPYTMAEIMIVRNE